MVSLLPNFSIPPMDIPVTVLKANQRFTLSAVIDSESSGNFIDMQVAERLGIAIHLLKQPQQIYAINGAPIGTGTTTHRTETIILQTSWLHKEEITLLITDSPKHDIILGLPWLKLHDPTISWKERTMTKWSTHIVNTTA